MRKLSILVLALAFVALWSAGAFLSTATADEAKHQYVGATKCKLCHKKEAGGEQYVKWQASSHAKAYETLGTEEAKKIGAKVGVENPQESDTCLRCHVTGHGAPAELLGTKYSAEEGVTCESCHGAGGDYYKKKTMEGLLVGKIDPKTVGFIMPTEETCVQCHNDKSPTFAGFDFEKYSAKIAHNMPAEYKAAAVKKAGGE
jgi:cytochrome c553